MNMDYLCRIEADTGSDDIAGGLWPSDGKTKICEKRLTLSDSGKEGSIPSPAVSLIVCSVSTLQKIRV